MVDPFGSIDLGHGQSPSAIERRTNALEASQFSAPPGMSVPLCTQGSKARANLFHEELRLFPGRVMAAFVEHVVVDELVIGPFCPAPRRLVVLAGKHAHG